MSLTAERIALFEVPMTLRAPFESAEGVARELRHLLVRIDADGLIGWGECAATEKPSYVGETNVASWPILEQTLAPAVLGVSWSHPSELIGAYAHVKGNTFARAAVEAAAWDLFAQSRGVSLAQALGGTRASIAAGASVGLGTVEDVVERVGAELAAGYRRVKLKLARGRERELLGTTRARFPDAVLTIDANGAYHADDPDDVAAVRALDAFALAYVEQPFAAEELVAHAELACTMRTPICLDESIRNYGDLRTALALKSLGVLCLKAGRVGGLIEALRIHDACRAVGLPLWCGGMHEYGIGRAANVALASLPGFTLPGDVAASTRAFAADLVEPAITVAGGEIVVPQTPGLGYAVDVERIERTATRRASLTRPTR